MTAKHMKIFSLQSRTNLWAWSVVLAFIIDLVLYAVSQIEITVKQTCSSGMGCLDYLGGYRRTIDLGWPFKFHGYVLPYDPSTSAGYIILVQYSFILNLLFWILVSLIILSLIRYFRNKRV
jgi:hypothetical protein